MINNEKLPTTVGEIGDLTSHEKRIHFANIYI